LPLFNNKTESSLKIILPMLLAGASIVLTACGGGAEDTASTRLLSSSVAVSDGSLPPQLLARKRVSTTTNTSTTNTTTPTTTTTTTTTSGGALDARLTCNLPSFQQEIIDRINQARAAGRSCGTTYYGPAPALAWNTNLFNAAAAHSTDMAANNYFSHTSLDGRNAGQRITGAGYAWSAYGENIAAGQTSVQSVVDGWLASPGHCANIMNPGYADIGTACVASSTSSYPTYWTMDLARPY
jgi:uncharacterized protein YkwD